MKNEGIQAISVVNGQNLPPPACFRVNKAPKGKIHDSEKDEGEIELTTSEQWERVNDLLLLITTIMIFNATSLFIAIIQITWKDEGTVSNKTLVLQSQIGKSTLLAFIKSMR